MERETVRPTQFLYVFQLLYGVALGAGGLFVYRRFQQDSLGFAGVGTLAGLAFLTLAFVVYLQNLHKRADTLQPDYSRTCYGCRLPVNRYSEFCEHCGADQIERVKVRGCPECQVEVYEGTAFCPSCGSDLRNRKLKKLSY